MVKKVRTRFAPSPTGSVHIGSLQKIIYSYAFAKKNGGDYLLRVEDTDQKRFVESAENEFYLIHDLMGIRLDESPKHPGKFGPYKQSERLDLYKKYIDQLIEDGHAYYAFESPEELTQMREEQQREKQRPRYRGIYRDFDLQEAKKKVSAGEKYVVRIKVPKDDEVKIQDMILGEVIFKTNELDDYILFKSDGFPTYHLANVVDDHLMEISHVFRGVEWLPTAPIHVLLYEFLEWETPQFAHIPNILDPKGGKLSKRSGSVALMDFLAKGYLPEAIINFITLLGWSPKTDNEFFTLEELVKIFDAKGFNKSNPVFNIEKLNWFNEEYIRKFDTKELHEKFTSWLNEFQKETDLLKQFSSFSEEQQLEILKMEQERITIFSDFTDKLQLFISAPDKFDFEHKLLKKINNTDISNILNEYLELLEADPNKLTKNHDSWETGVRAIVEKLGYKPGEVFMALRVAITGATQSPPLFEFAQVIGIEETKQRLTKAIKQLAEK